MQDTAKTAPQKTHPAIKREEIIGDARLLLGDCLDILPTLGKVDAVITDPPYGTTACKWDTAIELKLMWQQLKGITKQNSAVIIMAAQPFTSNLVMSNIKMYKQHLIWEKTRPNNVMNAKKMFMKWHEDIVIFYESLPTYHPQKIPAKHYTKVQHLQDRSSGHLGKTGENDRFLHDNGGEAYPKSVLKFSNVSRPHVHPTQKPVDLIEYLMKSYTNENNTVLDFTMGSGTTGVACMNLGRKFIGIEIEEKYFDIACERIDQAQRQGRLFE